MKKIPLILLILFVLLFSLSAFGQADGGFYKTGVLRSDLEQVDAVVYVNVTARRLVDSMGSGDCDNNKGSGYCLYELTADVKEVFKGKITGKTLKFFTTPDADIPKTRLMGEQVVFLNKNKLGITNTMEFFTLENSTRRIEFDVLGKLRKVRRSIR